MSWDRARRLSGADQREEEFQSTSLLLWHSFIDHIHRPLRIAQHRLGYAAVPFGLIGRALIAFVGEDTERERSIMYLTGFEQNSIAFQAPPGSPLWSHSAETTAGTPYR